jgi:catechol 2,3-dioxygenase-like lactoylglutathione lyase family enzyme
MLDQAMDLNHLHLHVRDLAAARRFYETYFGFHEHVRHGEILFLRNGEGFDLALVPDPGAAHSFPSWFHFGFRMESPAAVRALLDRLRVDGLPPSREIIEEPDLVAFRVADPDGHAIEVYWE